MIDTESEPGAWEREMAQGPKCEWCRHYRSFPVWDRDGRMSIDRYCSLQHSRPLVPCSEYEREPGSDG